MKISEQLRLLPYTCGLNGCTKEAVCGLQNKSEKGLRFNVCAECYKKVTGKEWEPAAKGRKL